MDNELREKLAAQQHEIWAHWMKYMFSVCIYKDLDEPMIVIPDDKLQRWMRQLNTPYAELTEKEKESDREQADKIIALLNISIEGKE